VNEVQVNESAGRPLWYGEFEELIDAILPTFRPDWRLPDPPAYIVNRPELQPHWRCNRKRSALHVALRANLSGIRAHKDALLHLAVHDLNPSLNRFLILPIIEALGHPAVHMAIIGYLENGTFVEQLGAMKAWYTAQPGLHYRTMESFDHGDPTIESATQYADWTKLRTRYRQACQRAIEKCTDPKLRSQLSELAASFAVVVHIGEL
jgi:hypothetical protein